MVRMKKMAAIAGVIALLAPSAAFAQSSVEGYGGSNSVVAGLAQGGGNNSGGGGGGNETQSSGTSGSLPFTGADLGILAAAGGLLVGLGFGLRRLTHRPTQA
jgi:opacity protein-like surface antigen